jgi:hypothetical protein
VTAPDGLQRISRILLLRIQNLVILIFMKGTIDSQRLFAASKAGPIVGASLSTTLLSRSSYRKEAP